MSSKVQKPAAKPKAEVRRTADGRIMPPNAGKGRKKGVPNKVTQTAKEAIAMLADGMTGELQDWLRASAYGVGTAWVPWTPPEDWDGIPPDGAKVSGKVIKVPVLGDDGKAARVSLADFMAGSLPAGAEIQWIVKPDPGGSTDTMLRALEYHIPKLSRAEVTGANGASLIPATINVVGVKAPKRSEK